MGAYSADSTRHPAAVSDGSPSSRSFFSRFALPIRSRTRHVADFHIRATEPHRKYAAGDHVGGHVVLTIIKPVRITHLTVALHGFVRVFKGPNAANEASFNPAEIPSDGGSKKPGQIGNGYAGLFQDEQVLSADGKLEPGKYEFGFDLVFPPKGLPSSIDFERGTISYMITATLTRPNGMTPTQSCERKIYLMEQLDIGVVTPPRPRTIYLEPISKKSKRRKAAAAEKGSAASDTPEAVTSDPESGRAAENSTEGSSAAADVDDASQEVQYNPRSPNQSDIRSEVSGDSALSGSTGPSGRGQDGPNGGSSVGSLGVAVRASTVDEKTITATIELLKGGCLPGDVMSVKISVQHIKRIKSIHGVIVTLYRQGRIDSAPPISLFTDLSKEDMRRLEKEEYYPRSKTGLGGLSLSSTGSCSVFRKDLSQSFSPLIIDPVTLSSSVTASIRVPEDAFPTIKGVPGEMITFKYQLEVIVDLGGKLASQLQSGQSKPGGAPGATPLPSRNPYEAGSAMLASYGQSIIDTDQLRRQKGVISVAFEVVVGTSDSSRQRGRGLSRKTPSPYAQRPDEPQPYPEDRKHGRQARLDDPVDEGYGQGDESPYPYPDEHPAFRPEEPPHHLRYHVQEAASSPPAPFYVPPPEIEEESRLSEKERIRRAEQRLLPSQPHAGDPTPGPSDAQAEEANIYDAEDTPSAPQPTEPTDAEAPSAPTLEDLSPAEARANPSEDKQELERQRLLTEASAPPEFPEDYDGGAASSSGPSAPTAPVDLEPSAPVLSDEDEYGPHYAYNSMAGPSSPVATHVEPLPRYER